MSHERHSAQGCAFQLARLGLILALVEVGALIAASRMPSDVSAAVGALRTLDLIGGIVWAALFLILAVPVLRRQRSAVRAAVWSLVAFLAYNAVRWYAFVRADYDRQRLPLLIAGTLIAAIVPLVLLLGPGRAELRKREMMFDDRQP
jgi:hypothetical protein